MRRLKYWIRNFFGFSRTETNGFLILLPLMLLVAFSQPIYRNFFYLPESSYARDAELDSLIANWNFNPDKITLLEDEKELFLFNPNSASREELESLGLTPYLAKRIIKYRDKGGSFRIKSDLLRIYGLDTTLYIELEPFIELPIIRQKVIAKSKSKRERKIVTTAPFDINTADSTQLKSVFGIGTVLAERIAKFRNKLGGFTNLNQLHQVYGLDSNVAETLKSKSFIPDAFIPKKIDINEATVQELANHPYISYKLAKTIITYRFQHGKFNEIDDLLKIDLIDLDTYEKIKPYLITRL